MFNLNSAELIRITKVNTLIETLNSVQEELEKHGGTWRNVQLNIGFIGESGSGKSTLINSLRGLYPRDPGAATTDVKECTKIPSPYSLPNNPNITLYDLPGVNTPCFPLETYIDKISKLNG